MKSIFKKYSINRDYFLILWLLLNSSGIFLREYIDYSLIINLFFLVIVIVFLKNKIEFDKYFIVLLSFYIAWCLGIFIKYQLISPITYLGFFVHILCAYFTIKIVKKNFFPLFVKIVYHLSLVSLPIFFIGLFFPNVMKSIYSILSPHQQYFSNGRPDGITLYIYSFSLSSLDRNFGFMWEPGALAGILIIALMVHLAINVDKQKKVFCILSIALFTTYSTTGYLAFFYVLIYKIYISKIQKKLFYVIIAMPILMYFCSSEFVKDKIIHESEQAISNRSKIEVSPDRFTSFLLDINDYKNNLVIGVGLNSKTRYATQTKYAASTCGVSDYLVKFGGIGFILLLLNLHKSFKMFINSINLKGHILFVLAILTVSFSEAFLYLPLFWAFQFYQFAGDDTVTK